MYGVELTGGCAAAIAQTAIGTGLDPLAGQGHGRFASLDSNVITLWLVGITGPGATDESGLLL